MRSLGSRQTLSGCLKGCSPDELRNGVDDSNQRGPRKGIGLVPQYFGRSKPSMAHHADCCGAKFGSNRRWSRHLTFRRYDGQTTVRGSFPFSVLVNWCYVEDKNQTAISDFRLGRRGTATLIARGVPVAPNKPQVIPPKTPSLISQRHRARSRCAAP